MIKVEMYIQAYAGLSTEIGFVNEHEIHAIFPRTQFNSTEGKDIEICCIQMSNGVQLDAVKESFGVIERYFDSKPLEKEEALTKALELIETVKGIIS